MPGKKQYKDQADVDMLRAAWDSQADMELGAGVAISLTMERTTQKGVYELTATAHSRPAVWAVGAPVSYSVRFPSSTVVTLAGQVFRAMTALDRMVAEAIDTKAWQLKEGPWEG